MKVNELVEKLQNGNPTTQDYEMVIQWCTENVDTIDLSNKNVSYLFDIAMRYLMNDKLLHWDKTDARLIINYLARDFVHKNKISDKVTIEILEEGQNADVYSVADFLVKQRNISREEAIKFLQEEGYFEIANNPAAHCSSDTKDSTSHIYYTSVITDYILSKEPDKIVYGLESIIHEVTHAVQHHNLFKELENYSGNNYILAMEMLMQNADRIFQGINYSNLFSENQANCIGLQNARDFIKQYNHEFYEQCEPQKVEDRILTYISWMYPKNPISEFKGEKVNTFDLASQVTIQTIQKTPEILEQMPVLKKAYNSDGSQKSVEQLLEEREQGIASKKDIELLNSLYEEIFTYRRSNSREDLTSLIDYIERTGAEDKFIYGVVQSRMENLQYTPEEIKSRVAALHETAIEVRSNQDRAMQEPEQEKSEVKSSTEKTPRKHKSTQEPSYHNDEIFKREFDEHMKQVQAAKERGDQEALADLSREMRYRSGYSIYLSEEDRKQAINPYFKDYMDKREFDAHMKAVEEAKAKGDKEALAELSGEMWQRSGYGSYLSELSRAKPINSYFKDYMDKREFDEHMRQVAVAKENGDKEALAQLSNEMYQRSGYGSYLSEASRMKPINSYFKDYMDKRQKELRKAEAQKHRTQEESFRDEIGDDKKDVEVSKGASQDAQWMDTMKGFSDKVTEIEGYAKKQGEMVQAISMAEKQQETQRTSSPNLEDTVK